MPRKRVSHSSKLVGAQGMQAKPDLEVKSADSGGSGERQPQRMRSQGQIGGAAAAANQRLGNAARAGGQEHQQQ